MGDSPACRPPTSRPSRTAAAARARARAPTQTQIIPEDRRHPGRSESPESLSESPSIRVTGVSHRRSESRESSSESPSIRVTGVRVNGARRGPARWARCWGGATPPGTRSAPRSATHRPPIPRRHPPTPTSHRHARLARTDAAAGLPGGPTGRARDGGGRRRREDTRRARRLKFPLAARLERGKRERHVSPRRSLRERERGRERERERERGRLPLVDPFRPLEDAVDKRGS